jgi:hypothetical protein
VHKALDAARELQIAAFCVRQCTNNEDIGWTDLHALSFALAPVSVDYWSDGAGRVLAIMRTGQVGSSDNKRV